MAMGNVGALQSAVVDKPFTTIEKAAFSKIAWRIVPLLTIAYIVNFLKVSFQLGGLFLNIFAGIIGQPHITS